MKTTSELLNDEESPFLNIILEDFICEFLYQGLCAVAGV